MLLYTILNHIHVLFYIVVVILFKYDVTKIKVGVAIAALVPVCVAIAALVPVCVAIAALVPVCVAIAALVPVCVAIAALVPVCVAIAALVIFRCLLIVYPKTYNKLCTATNTDRIIAGNTPLYASLSLPGIHFWDI